jgi:hypothetical protein
MSREKFKIGDLVRTKYPWNSLGIILDECSPPHGMVFIVYWFIRDEDRWWEKRKEICNSYNLKKIRRKKNENTNNV